MATVNPIPKPKARETWPSYVKRMMRVLAREFPNPRQRFAVIANTWRQHFGGAAVRKIARENPGKKVPLRNPGLTVFANPGKGPRVVGVLTSRVYAIQYRHATDGKDYEHKFKPGVKIELLADGSLRVRSTRGKPLWGNF